MRTILVAMAGLAGASGPGSGSGTSNFPPVLPDPASLIGTDSSSAAEQQSHPPSGHERPPPLPAANDPATACSIPAAGFRKLGNYSRYLCLLGFIAYQIRFLARGAKMLKGNEGEMAGIFICDDPDNPEITQCTGHGDTTTCGASIECIRSSCGRPLLPHVGVSYAGSSRPFDADSATSTRSFITILSLLYSLIPHLLQVFFVIRLLATGSVIPLTRLGFIGFESLVNDAVMKNIIRQPRPKESCLYFHSYGMPSGHAACSIGLLTYMLLELFYHPLIYGNVYSFHCGYGWHECLDATESDGSKATSLLQRGSEDSAPLSPSTAISESDPTPPDITPLQPKEFRHRSKRRNRFYAFLWTVLLLPVPWSCAHLRDHSLAQVLAGCLVGNFLGRFWYFGLMRGHLFWPDVDSRDAMDFLANSRLGKWAGMNLGASKEKRH